MVEIPDRGVSFSDRGQDHLWRHGLEFHNAEEVWIGPAKYFEQAEREEIDADGRPWTQPARVVMIGPDLSGRLLTIILTQPDADKRSRVVTGWPANRDEQTRYNRPGGRMRNR